ncbi:PulJ/GspJ family protein [Propionivibrio limicola]|uniref:PulJ/GspJ family protein n=1 Tax=Propionivibrio limicola TaxID=167645 RepID=UPI0012915F27|nr:prepilin-type N-terminal cleavage/methylation domain-containing protein [Propionivibrio limicola]
MNDHRFFRPPPAARSGGFTLVELITVIVITGIIASMVAVFIPGPINAYVDTARRAELTENADTAIRRIARDLRTALPNSVRVVVSGGVTYLEFIPTSGGGRYRQYPTAGGAGDVLDFSNADSSFDVLGPVPVYAAGESVVLFNLGPGSASDAYAGNNRAALSTSNSNASLFSTDAAAHTLTFSSIQFPAPSPSARFHVVRRPVTYACAPNFGTPAAGGLLRYADYPFSSAQPTPPAGVAAQVLVGHVAECDFDYNEVIASAGVHTRTGLVTLILRLEDAGESVRLVHQMQVVNAP